MLTFLLQADLVLADASFDVILGLLGSAFLQWELASCFPHSFHSLCWHSCSILTECFWFLTIALCGMHCFHVLAIFVVVGFSLDFLLDLLGSGFFTL